VRQRGSKPWKKGDKALGNDAFKRWLDRGLKELSEGGRAVSKKKARRGLQNKSSITTQNHTISMLSTRSKEPF
jgi:hypothetical protein